MMRDEEKTKDQLLEELHTLRQKVMVLEAEQAKHAVSEEACDGMFLAGERKPAEEALREHEMLLNNIMNTSPVCIFLKDRDGRYLLANQAMAGLRETTPQAMIGKTDRDYADESFSTPAEAERFRDDDRRVIDNQERNVILEESFTLRDGTVKWFQTIKSPLTIAGSTPCVLGVAVDITDRKQAEEALRESEEKYRVLFESFPLGVTVSDKDGNILETNAIAETLLGVSRDEHEERTIDGQEWAIIRPDGTPMPAEEYASVRALKENRVITNVEMGIVKPDRDVTWINVTVAPIPLENYGVAITYGDISDRKRMEEQIKRSLQEKTVLLREIHHRVKNNMQSIVSLLRLQYAKITHQADLTILKEVEQCVRAMAIIHEMLYQADDFACIDFGHYVQSLMYGIWGAYGSAASHITPRIDVEQVFLGVDVAIACGLLVNELVVNCLKHAFPNEQEGEVRVNLHKEEQTIELIVSDTGVGLPENIDLNTSQTLGLTLIRGWVNQVQGTLEIDCTAGTCVRITFREPLYKTPGGSE